VFYFWMAVLPLMLLVAVCRPFEHTLPDHSRLDAKTLPLVVETWRLSHAGGHCPSLEDLQRDRLLKADEPIVDRWGNPFSILCFGDEIVIVSPGPDGEAMTEDDVATR
jgi:hypothetical protein